MRFFLFSLSALCSLSLHAQTDRVLEGVAREKGTQEFLAGVLVCAYPLHGQELLSFAISRDDGFFKLNIPSTNDSLRIELSCMGFSREERQIGPLFTSSLIVEMVPQVFTLNEVRVQAPEMSLKGDTMRYNLPAYAGITDRSIGDVLRHLPGITISTQGQIRYQGETVSNFYIENKDLMGRAYGVAVKNLPAEAFSMAEILENHQPVKILQNRESSSQTAINLRLKSAYKSTWMFTADADIGAWPLLWSARLMGAQFSSKWQSMHLYKSNNMGVELASELLAFTRGPGVYTLNLSGEQSLFSPADTPPPITLALSLFNHSHLFATKHLTNLNKNMELRVKANYLYDREESNRSVVTSYYLPSVPAVVINEHYNNERKTDQLDLELMLKANTESHFLENTINVKGSWSSVSSFLESLSPLSQCFELPNVQIGNNFTWMKRIGSRILKLGSELNYAQHPQSLFVLDDNNSQTVQHLGLYNFQASAAAELQQRIGKWSLTLNTGIRLCTQDFKTDLTGLKDMPLEFVFHNDIHAQIFEPYIEPGLQFNLVKSINFTCKLPLGYYWTSRLSDQFFFNPSLLMKWYISSAWELNVRYQRQTIYSDISQVHTGYIMRNYRQFDKGLDGLPFRLQNTYSLNLTYRSITGLMTYVRGNYISGFKNYAIYRELIDIYMFSQLNRANTPSKILSINSGLNKRFSDLRLSTGLSLSYLKSFMELVQQTVPIHYRSSSWTINPSITWNFIKDSFIEYQISLGTSQLSIKENKDTPDPLHQLRHKLSMTMAFSTRVYAQAGIEHYANKIQSNSFSQGIFGDAGLYLTYKKVKLRLEVKNIFNNDLYASAYYDDFNSILYTWKLRPRELSAGASWNF